MSLQIRTNKVCSCKGLLLSQQLHNVDKKRLHAFSMQLTQKNPPPPPPRPSYETLLAPLLNANALTSCQTLNPSFPQDNLPQPQKLTISPDTWALRGCLWLGLPQIVCALLASTKSPIRTGNTLWCVWEMHLKGLGGLVLLWLRGLYYLLQWVVAGPSDKPEELPRACFVGVPLTTVDIRGQQYCTFGMRYCRKGVVIFLFFPSFFLQCTNGI